MKIPNQKKVDFFKNLYEEAKSRTSAVYDKFDRHLKQYKGDKGLDGSAQDAEVVRNITYELIESEVTSYIPTAKSQPMRLSDVSEKNAKSIEMLIAKLKDRCAFERMNDMDERYTYIYGGSVWLVEWDESITTHNTVGEVRVTNISPRHFVGQPGIYNVQDMEYCFVSFETTKEDIMRRYDVSLEVAENTESDEDVLTDDTATLYVCYYKDDDDNICQYVWSGDVEVSAVDDYYARKREYCTVCGKRRALCECESGEYEERNEEYEELTHDVVTSHGIIPAMSEMIREGRVVTETKEIPVLDPYGNQVITKAEGGLLLPQTQKVEVPVLEPTKIPYYRPKLFPIVIRINTSEEDNVFGQSDCEFIRPQQQAINKIETRIMQKLVRAGITPVLPEDASVTLNNSVFGQVIRMKPGQTAQGYGVIDNTPSVAQDLEEAERLYNHAKRTMGISDSFQGQYDASAKSGVAKQAQIQQASGRLDSKRRMKNIAYSDIFNIAFELYLAYADEPRPAAYKDSYGQIQEVSFNRYDFVKRDEAGEYYIDDGYLFSADSSQDITESRELIWQENRLNFEKGAYGDPMLPESQLSFWINMERAHYPFASQQVDRVREIIDARRKEEAQAMLEALKEQDALIKRQDTALKAGEKALKARASSAMAVNEKGRTI